MRFAIVPQSEGVARGLEGTLPLGLGTAVTKQVAPLAVAARGSSLEPQCPPRPA